MIPRLKITTSHTCSVLYYQYHIISYWQGILTLCKLKVRNKSFSQKWFSKSGSIRYFTKKQLNNNSKFVCLHEKIHCYMRTTRYQQTKTSCTDRKWGRFHTTIRCWQNNLKFNIYFKKATLVFFCSKHKIQEWLHFWLETLLIFFYQNTINNRYPLTEIRWLLCKSYTLWPNINFIQRTIIVLWIKFILTQSWQPRTLTDIGLQHLVTEDISVLSSVSLLFCHSVTAGPNIASAFIFIP